MGNSNTHEDDEVESVVRAACGRLILLYLPTYSPWLNPIELCWLHAKRGVCEPDGELTPHELRRRLCVHFDTIPFFNTFKIDGLGLH